MGPVQDPVGRRVDHPGVDSGVGVRGQQLQPSERVSGLGWDPHRAHRVLHSSVHQHDPRDRSRDLRPTWARSHGGPIGQDLAPADKHGSEATDWDQGRGPDIGPVCALAMPGVSCPAALDVTRRIGERVDPR